ncbi:MAG: hemin uptake protein HemP [Betaproteobacteria bacterium]
MDVFAHALNPASKKPNPQNLGISGLPRQEVIHTTSQALFCNATEIHIQHDGVLYRLRKTSLGKLILTK